MAYTLIDSVFQLQTSSVEFAKSKSRLKRVVSMRAKKGARLGALLGSGAGAIGGVYAAKARNPNASVTTLLGSGVAGSGLGALTQGAAGAAIYGGGGAIRYGSRKLRRKFRKKKS